MGIMGMQPPPYFIQYRFLKSFGKRQRFNHYGCIFHSYINSPLFTKFFSLYISHLVPFACDVRPDILIHSALTFREKIKSVSHAREKLSFYLKLLYTALRCRKFLLYESSMADCTINTWRL